MNPEFPVPEPNADTKPYFDAARAGRLLLKFCEACRKAHFPPRYLCPTCWSVCSDWIESQGGGRIYSFTVMHRAPATAFSARVPYVVALVDLDEGPRMLANVVGDGAGGVRIGDRVRVLFEKRSDGFALPQFERTAADATGAE